MDKPENKEEVSNVYILPTIPQSIWYLHAAVGFPVKQTFLDTIKAGNFVTWPGLTTTVVRKHFPDSDETQQGHIKKMINETSRQSWTMYCTQYKENA